MDDLKVELIEIVRDFRVAFGLRQDDLDLHLALLAEESNEFLDAKNKRDLADALADMVFVAAGGVIDGFPQFEDDINFTVIPLSKDENIDLLRATKTVYVSNMSKLCQRDEIKPTADKYAAIGVAVHFEPVDELDESAGFRCICSETVIGEDGKEYPKGKLLKSVGYKEPDWGYIDE